MFAKKSLGQNFLMHARIAERIVIVSGVGEHDIVLEVGPGTGMLTRELLKRVKKVVAVEADHTLVAGLEETFAEEIASGKLELIQGDIRSFDTAQVADPYTVVANIPYYITGEIIRKFLTALHKPNSMTLLVQKEVAVRIARDKKESLLSLSVKAYGDPEYCFTVPRGAFRPAPNVDSAVLAIRHIRSDAFADAAEEERFFAILHAGFAHKRKRLAKNLLAVLSAGDIADCFVRAGIAEHARSEDITLAQWRALASHT